LRNRSRKLGNPWIDRLGEFGEDEIGEIGCHARQDRCRNDRKRAGVCQAASLRKGTGAVGFSTRSEERRVGKERKSGWWQCQAEDGIRYFHVTGVQTCALPISPQSLSQARKSVDRPAG